MGYVGGQGVKVLEALAEGRPFRRSGDGWKAGGLNAPASVMGELARAALVREDGGTLALTAAGRLRVAKGRPARPNQLLVERPLPQDALSPTGKPRRSVTVNALESPLGWLRARGLVDQGQFDAGERLRADWTMAELGPRVTMRGTPRLRGRGGRAARSIRRWPASPPSAASKARSRPRARGWATCCGGWSARAKGWKRRRRRSVGRNARASWCC